MGTFVPQPYETALGRRL